MTQEMPLIPMGAITGRPDLQKVRSFLTAFREAGFTQFMLYPRTGCEVEYLSKEWFDFCRMIVEVCRELGFTSLWLYDEFNWPSGQCGGRIMAENPDHALQYLSVSEQEGVYTFGRGSNPLRPDVLNPEAMKKFIEYTHEQYALHFGQDFGGLIKGIFTDEPSFSYVGKCSGNEKLRLPFYEGLEEDYKALTGNDLRSDIIFTLRNNIAPFWKEFTDKLLGRRFIEAFVKPIRQWCDSHNLLMTGHLLLENTIRYSLASSGMPQEVTDTFSLPCVDELDTARDMAFIEWVTLGTAAHGIRLNQRGGMAELFALGPCDMTLAAIRRQIHLFGLFGIDHYLLAVAPFDMRGNTCALKANYFHCFTPAQPWFSALKQLNTEALASAAAARRKFVPEIAVRRPSVEAPLWELLIALSCAQRQWALIGENEESDAPVIMRPDSEGIYAEKMPDNSNHRCPVSTFLKFLDRISPLEVSVREVDGSLARDVFLRTFADNSAEIINYSPSKETRKLIFCRKESQVEFELAYLGVKSFCSWKVELDRPNLKRLTFENGSCRFNAASPLENVSLVLNSYGNSAAVELDGVPLEFKEASSSLPEGFRELYRETVLPALAQGEHILTLKGEVPNYPYLPQGFLAGAFADLPEGISSYGEDGAGLGYYTGKLIQSGVVTIPADAQTIELDTDNLYTELFMEGAALGERLYPPFIWRIPAEFAGKSVELRIERSTSCAPMFGSREEIAIRPDLEAWLGKYRPAGGVPHTVIEPVFK